MKSRDVTTNALIMRSFFVGFHLILSGIGLLVSGVGQGQGQGSDTTLPVPRFVSLRSDEVNLRLGPGSQYPIEWVLTRNGMPVEITQEYENWRRIRAVDGSEGWIHQRMVTGRRTAVVMGAEPQVLRRRPELNAAPVAQLEPGVIGELKACKDDWCRLEIPKSLRGWLPRGQLWGVYPKENFAD